MTKTMFRTIVGIALIVAALSCAWMLRCELIASFKTGIDLYADDTDFFNLSGTNPIDTEFPASLGIFAGDMVNQEYKFYYIIPVYSGEELYWIGLEVAEEDRAVMEQITGVTYSFLAEEDVRPGEVSIQKQGILKKLDAQKYQYMLETFREIGFYESEQEMEEHVLPLYISTGDPREAREMFLFFLGLFVAGVMLVIIQFIPKRFTTVVKPQTASRDCYRSKAILLEGIPYPKKMFRQIDIYVKRKETEYAERDLSALTGFSGEEAREIIDNWREYYK